MAPPHTMKGRDEVRLKYNIAPSSTTSLAPGLEGLHLSSNVPTPSTTGSRGNGSSVLAEATKNTTVPATPKHNRSSARVFTERSPELLAELKTWSPKWSRFPSPNETALLICFSCKRRKGQKTAARIIDETLFNIKVTAEKLAEPSEGFTDNDRELVLRLIVGNKEFVEAYDNYVCKLMMEVEGSRVWSKEVREIEGLCKAWEKAYPSGQWTLCIERLGELDERVVVDWEAVRNRIWKFHDEKRKKKEKKGEQKSGGDESDSGCSSESESSVDESNGAKMVAGRKKCGAKCLAEELKSIESNESDGSVGETDDMRSDVGNESMEYISPSKIDSKEERFEVTEELIASLENYALEITRLEAEEAANTPPPSFSETTVPSKMIELNFSPSIPAAKSLRPKTSGSSSPTARKSRGPVSPIKGTPTPAQSIPVAAIPSTAFNYTFRSAITAAKPPPPSFPAQATPTLLAQPVATSPSKAFDFDFIPFDSTAMPSRSLPPCEECPTSVQVTSAVRGSTTMPSHPPPPEGGVSTLVGTSVYQLSTPQPACNGENKGGNAEPTTATIRLPPFFGSRPRPSTSTPPVTPSIPSFNFGEYPKETLRNIKAPTAPTVSTLAQLTKTVATLHTSITNLHAAVYGLDTTKEPPRSVMDAGLLMMNNFIGEWVTDIRIQTKTLDTKVNEIGTIIQGLSQEVASAKTANSNLATQLNFFDLYAAGAEKENTKASSEMKEMMGKMMGQMKETREHEQKNFTALALQNQRLMHELATFKESKSVVEEEVRLLRSEHETFKKLVERVSRKVEMAVDYQRGLEEAKDDEEEDWLMWVLWPQGGWKDEGMKKRGVEKELERGVLADKPGFRVPQHELGRGKPGGGWCTVM
ncbi:uncharacterized protein K444DRAFT_658175 [Hyaloscypha bicolor E]|uniref:Uncharacterized protein n=1 Tax=Hyaloscypha bicolor E TaxID=1095630 RepID=A0A2J6TVF3_9HELO|nr:uncharacterized protein K444DRAFT_658175 [Hyaloscypha bicolor E]PMD66996.1 hypothetical protein K444DRAFT_658175 [Hyaloscypha bicolor E]